MVSLREGVDGGITEGGVDGGIIEGGVDGGIVEGRGGWWYR